MPSIQFQFYLDVVSLQVDLRQGLVSGVPFGTKEKCMAPANAFITSNRKLLIAALTKLRWERCGVCAV